MQSYTVHEWGKLTYGDDKNNEKQIPKHVVDRLEALEKRPPRAGRGASGMLERGQHELHARVLDFRRRELSARGVVGILAARDCSLEILPKIDVAPDAPDKQNATIRKRLIHMLAVVLDLKFKIGSITDLAWQRETLLEILIGIFCDKLTEAVRKGMPRRYVEQEDDLAALRGRLNVVRQFTRHAVNPSRLACRFDDLSKDIALNRIMKAALLHLVWMSRKPENQQRLRKLAFVDYADVADISPSALRWDEVVIDRTNRRWQELLSMARLFLQSRYQTTFGGAGQGTALLFEMNILFEEYVGRLISRALAGTDLRVSLQGGRKSCLFPETAEQGIFKTKGLFKTKPDILIHRADTVTHVIDTKWKRISSLGDDSKKYEGLSQDDVYQMMAYAQLYGAPRLTLLYPHHSELGDKEGVHCRYQINRHETVPETQSILEIATIDVADGENMLDRLRRRIIANEAVV